MAKPDYGIDAPHVVRNLCLFGLLAAAVARFFPHVSIGNVNLDFSGFYWTSGSLFLGAVLMLLYSTFGKFRHARRILDMRQWSGTEHVLDVGTGRGLLLVAAAKRLTTGRATGIDIWNSEDLTGNNVENALQNAEIEGVRPKVDIQNMDAQAMAFADGSFDVVVSNQVIHNIYNKEGRQKACAEMARVCRTGGCVLLSDFRHMREYEANFRVLGLAVEMSSPSLLTFPFLRILKVSK